MLQLLMNRLHQREPDLVVQPIAYYSAAFKWVKESNQGYLVALRSDLVAVDPRQTGGDQMLGATTMGISRGGFSIQSNDTGNVIELYVSSISYNHDGQILYWVLRPTAICLKTWPDMSDVITVVYNQ